MTDTRFYRVSLYRLIGTNYLGASSDEANLRIIRPNRRIADGT